MRATRDRPRPRRAGGQRGAASAELALATPLLLMLVFGVIQFALWQHAVHVAAAAAQEGARAARTEQGTAAGGRAAATGMLAELGRGMVRDPQVTVTRTADVTRVEVTGHIEAIVLGLGLPVRAVAESPTERFRPDARGLGEAGDTPGAGP